MSSHGFRTPLCNKHCETQPGGLFFQTGEILANLAPGQFREKNWSNFDEPGEKLNLPCDLVEF